MIKFNFENYVFEFPNLTDHKIFNEEWCYGIIFNDSTRSIFQLVHNYVGLTRLLINRSDSSWQDLPLNDSTLKLLPPEISFRRK